MRCGADRTPRFARSRRASCRLSPTSAPMTSLTALSCAPRGPTQPTTARSIVSLSCVAGWIAWRTCSCSDGTACTATTTRTTRCSQRWSPSTIWSPGSPPRMPSGRSTPRRSTTRSAECARSVLRGRADEQRDSDSAEDDGRRPRSDDGWQEIDPAEREGDRVDDRVRDHDHDGEGGADEAPATLPSRGKRDGQEGEYEAHQGERELGVQTQHLSADGLPALAQVANVGAQLHE